jgi:ribosomal protein S18 acetylase RimI-like enzyme
MNNPNRIRPIPPEQARLLRSQMLRPGLPMEKNIYDGDDAAESLILGAFDGEQCDQYVGTLTILHQPPPGSDDPLAWRMRGVATVPEVHGKRFGVDLVRAGLRYVAEQGGTMLWCNARTSAVGFYEKLGFKAEGEEFHSPDSGYHYYMWRPVTDADR